jgi:lipopolysaccharide/colanic/teichoic acid biosynthesis glycosyltransferase
MRREPGAGGEELRIGGDPPRPPRVVLTSLEIPGRPKRLVIGGLEDDEVRRVLLGRNGNGNGHGNGNGNGNGNGKGALGAGEIVPLDAGLTERLRSALPDEVHFILGGDVDEQLLASTAPALLTDGISVHVLLPEGQGPPVRTTIEQLGGQTCISLHPLRSRRTAAIVRRVLDVLGAGFLLALLGPAMVVVAALVWWTMGDPVVYAQERVGQFGRHFSLYKFRSMVADADGLLRASPEVYRRYVECNYKLPEEEDPRITPLGRMLRRTSLDELPQLWNVLRGDMSLVGPRPVVPDEVAMYGDYGRMLLRVKPGLTGAWQVTGRSMIPYPERARIDLQYVAQRSLRDDLGILLRTLPAVLRRRGAL